MRTWLVAGLIAAAPLMLGATTSTRPDPASSSTICGEHPADPQTAPAAAILSGYGTGGFKVRTTSAAAQAYFDNGMQLGHAFAHKASIAAFRRAEREDPNCAMCVWGEAWARGPTINYPIDAKTTAELKGLADRAAVLAADGPDKEKRLIAALQARYTRGGGKGPGDYAFARQMDALAKALADDNEIAIVAADAWMIPAAHKNSRENLPRAVQLIEAALKRNPDDTGAIHFYIHSTEMSGFAGRALPYAQRLQALAPAASHLVHMPSHTYYLVGGYRAAVRSNLDAVRIDEANAQRLKLDGGAWKLSYHGHNVQFGAGAALMDGDGEAALELAMPVISRIPELKAKDAYGQAAAGTAYFAYGRYGAQDVVAALPDPGSRLPYLQAMWHYARGEAAARRGDAAAVRREAAAMAADKSATAQFGDFARSADAMVQIAHLVLTGRAAMLESRYGEAASAYRHAADLQDSRLVQATDPPAWWCPVRRSYAAALLAAGKAAQADQQVAATLRRWPNDPLALALQARTDQALGREDLAATQLAQARRGWIGDLGAITPPLV